MPRPDLDAITKRWQWVTRPATTNMDSMQRAAVDIDTLLAYAEELEKEREALHTAYDSLETDPKVVQAQLFMYEMTAEEA